MLLAFSKLDRRHCLKIRFLSFFFNNFIVLQPLQTKVRPGGKWVLLGPKGKSVTALLKKVSANGSIRFFECIGIDWTSWKEALVVFGCYNQGRADLIGNSKVLAQLLPLVHVGRVKQNREVRLQLDVVMLIDLLIGLNIKARTDPCRKVSTRGRPHYANPLWIYVPLRCPRADNPTAR